MKTVFLALSLIFSSTAFAHFEIGTYQGIDAQGNDCAIEFIKKTYVDDIKNPLSERVLVKVLDEEYETYHPLIFTPGTEEISFNHDYLMSHKGTSDGARVLAIDMSHVEGKEGPGSYELVENNWRNSLKSKYLCLDLVFIGTVEK